MIGRSRLKHKGYADRALGRSCIREEKQPVALEELGLEVRILSNLIYNRLNQITMEVENLTIHQYWVLSYLTASSGKEVYQKEIEQLFSIKRSTTNEMSGTVSEDPSSAAAQH